MIIDCHGHYTVAPEPHRQFRETQLTWLDDPSLPEPVPTSISDDQIRETIEPNQLRLQRERGIDLALFSPRASAMAHHLGDERTAIPWARQCNDLNKRVVDLYPDNFIGVCQLPQTPATPIANSIHELERCVNELGFVGCNLNPDPSGGHWTSAPLTDRSCLRQLVTVTWTFIGWMQTGQTSCGLRTRPDTMAERSFHGIVRKSSGVLPGPRVRHSAIIDRCLMKA